MNRQTYPADALFPLRGDLYAEAGATRVEVIGLQNIPIAPNPRIDGYELTYVAANDDLEWLPDTGLSPLAFVSLYPGDILVWNGFEWTNAPLPPSSLVLETNGHINNDQALLNLKQGTGITLSDDGLGNITLTATGGGTGTVTQVNTGTGLTGGPITGSGTVSLANTAVSPNTYTLATITVDQQGRITAASSGSAGSGTVVSVGLVGTASQLTVTGSTPITGSGSWTLSLPSAVIFPGTVQIASGDLLIQGATYGTLIATAATANWTLTLPTDPGTGHSGYVLATDGSGNTSWVAQSGSAGVAANTQLWFCPLFTGYSTGGWVGYTLIVRMPGTHLLAPATSWKIRLRTQSGTGAHFAAFKIFKVLADNYSPSTAGSTVVSSTNVTIGGNMPATITGTSPFDIVTDAISLTLDPLYDYYAVMYFNADGTYNATLNFYSTLSSTTTVFTADGSPMSGGYVSGDHSGDSTLPALGNGSYAFNNGLVYGVKKVVSA